MISSVNVTKSAVSCGFDTFTEEILNGKLQFLYSEGFFIATDLSAFQLKYKHQHQATPPQMHQTNLTITKFVLVCQPIN